MKRNAALRLCSGPRACRAADGLFTKPSTFPRALTPIIIWIHTNQVTMMSILSIPISLVWLTHKPLNDQSHIVCHILIKSASLIKGPQFTLLQQQLRSHTFHRIIDRYKYTQHYYSGWSIHFCNTALSYHLPDAITPRIFLILAMSSSGLLFTRSRSALLPTSMVPNKNIYKSLRCIMVSSFSANNSPSFF